ncbi:hypothetical protein BN874_990035 [Candidatus Contendobacter odensis Run_B_J11]|uniref:Uncharacterized protein n=1 Tax=Candidatus Contendobacter odensis Run_B_J11 TaxID=1400861 RepID=A0A7U7J6D6_9GAMM|nr:hypothetical protein BN874_990035 [Candidatus Contendobacter odensis Run_B_J11]
MWQWCQDLRFPSFPRQRESSKPLKKLDTCFREYDDFKRLSKNQVIDLLNGGVGLKLARSGFRAKFLFKINGEFCDSL